MSVLRFADVSGPATGHSRSALSSDGKGYPQVHLRTEYGIICKLWARIRYSSGTLDHEIRSKPPGTYQKQKT